MRHLERTHRCDVQWIHERYLDGEFEMYKIETDAQAADIFTKPFKDVKRWTAVRDLVLVVDVRRFGDRSVPGGGGVLPPCPFERIKDAKRRSEEGGDEKTLGLTTLHGSEVADAPPDDVGKRRPSDQLTLPSRELGSFDEVSKRAGSPDRELLRRGATVLESLSR
eukprot:8137139-Prorocentrum_lima.AAC.1